MNRTRTILLIVIGVLLVMVAIHFTVNGVPSLDSLNPHTQ
jgi:hypothetical protein